MRPALERVRDGAHHGVLADQVVEACRTVFARQHAIAGVRRRIAEIQAGGFRGFAHRAIRPAAAPAALLDRGNWWEADERPDPCSLGLLPSGPDPVGEWLVHRQPPGTYIGPKGAESKAGELTPPRAGLTRAAMRRFCLWKATMDGRGKPGHDEKMESLWSLHPQLAQDTVPVGDLPLSRVLLANDANFPWLILVPRRPGLVELIDLEENAQIQLLGRSRCRGARAQIHHRMRETQYRRTRQPGLAIACARDCTPA